MSWMWTSSWRQKTPGSHAPSPAGSRCRGRKKWGPLALPASILSFLPSFLSFDETDRFTALRAASSTEARSWRQTDKRSNNSSRKTNRLLTEYSKIVILPTHSKSRRGSYVLSSHFALAPLAIISLDYFAFFLERLVRLAPRFFRRGDPSDEGPLVFVIQPATGQM